MKVLPVALVLAVLTAWQVDSQEILTADRFMQALSAHYATVQDYEAEIAIRSGGSNMVGTASYLAPSSMRIDFSQPSNQVIVFAGGSLTVFLPDLRVVLNQEIGGNSSTAGASLASEEGLLLLRRNYVPAFVSSPEPIPLEAGSQEQVVKIRLLRRNISEGFREIILSVNPKTNLIRRIEATTMANVVVQFDFSSIRINTGIPELRFAYTPPAGSSTITNFMFRNSN
ncbi:MAG: outer-membrane lipoprotein carrier protein LolA [Treponema sp.]|nr:outer-membrane lipoprotein carrier protein LolA [Treponema sp.]